jgi:hypothetical protein
MIKENLIGGSPSATTNQHLDPLFMESTCEEEFALKPISKVIEMRAQAHILRSSSPQKIGKRSVSFLRREKVASIMLNIEIE